MTMVGSGILLEGDRWVLMTDDLGASLCAPIPTTRALGSRRSFIHGTSTSTGSTCWTLRESRCRINDINPNPDSPGRLGTNIDLDSAEASIEVALLVAQDFRLSTSLARSTILEVEAATQGWRQEAQALGLPHGEVDRMAVAFESDQRRFARHLV
jgi:hypothetical protein